MKPTFKSIAMAATLGISSVAPVVAEDMKTLGTPITSKNIVDVFEIQRTITNLTNAVDSAQWEVIETILASDVFTTIGEPAGGQPVKKPEGDILARWRSFFETTEKFVLHHVTSNDRIYFEDADNATVFSKGVIVVENTPAGAYAEEGGTLRGYRWINYEFGVTRAGQGWEVNKVLVDYLVQDWQSLEPSS